MTRRLTLAILATVWGVLVLTGAGTYLAVRAAVLADLDATIVARAAAVAAGGGGAAAMPDGDRFVARNDLGQTLARPSREGDADAPRAPPAVLARQFTLLPGGRRMRTLTLRFPPARPDAAAPTVVYGTPSDGCDRLLADVATALVGSGAFAGLLTAFVAGHVARAAMRPLRDTARAIGEIDESRLSRRVAADGLPPELRPVADTLNAMLGRVETAFARRRQFLADAAHELRTPVAALLMTLEVAARRRERQRAAAGVSGGRAGQADAIASDALDDALVEARFLRRLVEALLADAKSDAPEGAASAGRAEPVDVAALLRECVTIAGVLGRAKGVEVAGDLPASADCVVPAARLRSIATNLLCNAVDATDAGGRVDLVLAVGEGQMELTVEDSGRGIAPEHLPHVFEPFYRADAARRSDEGHLGLGLFLVRSHARAMRGECSVRSEVGRGTRFAVRWPVEPPCDAVPVGAGAAGGLTEL